MNPAASDEPRFAASCVGRAARLGQVYFRGATATSQVSEADARGRAQLEADRRAEAAANGKTAAKGRYPYPRRPLNEPVLECILFSAPGGPQELGRVTRNSYGASVLNAYRVMFVDVDTVPDSSNAVGEKIVSHDAAIAALASLCAAQPELGFRIYATFGGLRYLCTTQLFDPVSAESEHILQALRADERYATLCRVQKCYRARLTPKSWRCVAGKDERSWFARLAGTPNPAADSTRFAACRYADSVGRAHVLPEAAQIIRLHDTVTEALSDKRLA